MAGSLVERFGLEVPVIGGAMYPCSNPELVAAVSAAGGIGVLQPVTLVYVCGLDFRDGVRRIRQLTDRPIGMNVITERSSKRYLERMSHWLDIAVEEGVRFFVTSLGNPRWIVDRVAPVGGVVYHDVTERKWALKARDAGVHGLIGVNDLAGGHAGARSPEALYEELADLGLPLVAAGGVGDAAAFRRMLDLGYEAVQIGTRLIATSECQAPESYKQAIVRATADDIVLTHRITGVPVAVIRTDKVAREGTEAGPLEHFLLTHPRLKHWTRALYTLRSALRVKGAMARGVSHRDYLGAGRSVDGVDAVEPVAEILARWRRASVNP